MKERPDFDYSDFGEEPTKAELLESLAHQYLDLQKQLNAAEGIAEEIEKSLEYLKTKAIPEAAEGMTKIVTASGIEIEIESYNCANLPKADSKDGRLIAKRVSMLRWMHENGFGDLIDSDIGVKFSRNDHEAAKKLREELGKKGLPVYAKEGVHHSRWKKFLKDAAEEGIEFPEFFEVFPLSIAKVKAK